MSSFPYSNAFFVDTRYLRDHVSALLDEKKIALQLYEQIKSMKNLDEPFLYQKYNLVMNDIDQLVGYFQKMAESLEYIEQEAIKLSGSLREIINEDAVKVNIAVSESFML